LLLKVYNDLEVKRRAGGRLFHNIRVCVAVFIFVYTSDYLRFIYRSILLPQVCLYVFNDEIYVSFIYLLTYLFTYVLNEMLMCVRQGPEGYAARTGDPMEQIQRRLEQLEANVGELKDKVDDTLDTYKEAEHHKMRRQQALNRLIRAIAEVCTPLMYHTVAPERIWKWGVGHTSGAKHRNFFCRSPPLFWLYKYNESFWWALSWWSVEFGEFQPFVKVGYKYKYKYNTTFL